MGTLKESGIPEHWVEVKLESFCSMVYGKGLLTKELTENGYPVYGANGVIGRYREYLYEEEKVIISCRGAASGVIHKTIPKSFITSNSIVFNFNHFYININFFKYALDSVNKEQIITGSAQPQITIDNLKKLSIPLPPLNEQKRIVEKLDALLPKVKSAKTRLEKIPAILKKFRQSVLAAACSGRLTEEWREGKEFNLKEKFNIVIDERKKDKKYCNYLNNLLKLDLQIEWFIENDVPDSWLVTKLGVVCPKITDGTHDTPKRLKEGIPYITGKHIKDRLIDFNNCDYVSPEDHRIIYSRCNPEFNDVLMVNIGAGTATPARVNVKNEFSMKNVALLKVDNILIIGEYLEYHQLRFKDYIFNQVTKGGAQPFLSLDTIKSLPFYLPPLEEQHEIVRRVEKLFALADSLEAKYKKALARVEKLEQAILAKAFRGELVEPDPNDEPAIELLKKILEEKAKLESTKSKRMGKHHSNKKHSQKNGQRNN